MITLYQAVLGAGQLRHTVALVSRLGVGEIVQVVTDRCSGRALDRAELQRIATRTARGGRGAPPAVGETVTFREALERSAGTPHRILCYERETGGPDTRRAVSACADGRDVAVFIGPEGGFSPEEVRDARDAGCEIITLGPRILLARDAAAVALAWVSYETEIGGERQ